MRSHWNPPIFACVLTLFFASTLEGDERSASRQIINLDGTWDIAEGSMETMPEQFAYRVPVPGLVDMSSPDFFEVGIESDRRQAFWYRRTLKIPGELPEVALLKVHKAKYGTAVFLNKKSAGVHLPCFTPGYFNVRPHLLGQGATNELIIRVGAYKDAIPESMPDGWDFEKYKYIPGIYDSVELILTGTPRITNIQVAPELEDRTVRIQARIESGRAEGQTSLHYDIREASSGQEVAMGQTPARKHAAGEEFVIDFRVPMPNCRLWTPESPFLYELVLSTGADHTSTRFGMRSFTFDPERGYALLNGKPYFMRGTNVCIYRFFEDADRDDLPWRQDWVRRLHRRFKDMHWNSIRYCIGFPPEMWYRIADEVGFLIQDEFPIWSLGEWPKELKSEAIAREYREWMRERWNHPCVVMWDAQNESVTTETGKALTAVRGLDLSDRPWDNGWALPQGPRDTLESHPYFFIRDHFGKSRFRMAEFAKISGKPGLRAGQAKFKRPIIINEYAWLWINRDGTPTSLTRKVYDHLLGPDSTTEQRREIYARYLAAQTEFWRAHRQCAAVMHFCGLGYCRPGGSKRPVAGATSDNFVDVEQLIYEPFFERSVRDAFAPVGLMLDLWDEEIRPAEKREVAVHVINDLYSPWSGLVRLRLERGAEMIKEESRGTRVSALGKEVLTFKIEFPLAVGSYRLVAELFQPGTQPVRSSRFFDIVARQEQRE